MSSPPLELSVFEGGDRDRIRKNYEIVARNLEHKEENIRLYDEFIDEVTGYQRSLRAL